MGCGMTLSVRKIEEMAPDQRSLTAAAKLRKPAKWPLLAVQPALGLIWGECQGSGANPYRTVLDTGDFTYKCSCPRRKFACKHVLALGWQFADGSVQFHETEVPQWIEDWLGRRRGPSKKRDESGGAKHLSAAAAERGLRAVAVEDDPEVAAKKKERALAQAARLRAQRHASILEGLDAFDRWLLDMLGQGIASALPELSTLCRSMARRLVDAKASGLAGMVDELPSLIYRRPERERAEALLMRVGRLHLLAQGYRNLGSLPEALQADVRRSMGWATSRDELLNDPSAPRVDATWQVFANRAVLQADDLRRVETWLVSEGDDEPGSPRFAALIDYHPASVGKVVPSSSPGDRFAGEAVFYPSAMPLRAIIDRHDGPVEGPGEPPLGLPLADALSGYRRRLVDQPWLETWPLIARDVVITNSGDRFALTDGLATLPIDPTQQQALRTVRGMPLERAFGLWDGEFLVLAGAHTSLGRWAAEGLVE